MMRDGSREREREIDVAVADVVLIMKQTAEERQKKLF